MSYSHAANLLHYYGAIVLFTELEDTAHEIRCATRRMLNPAAGSTGATSIRQVHRLSRCRSRDINLLEESECEARGPLDCSRSIPESFTSKLSCILPTTKWNLLRLESHVSKHLNTDAGKARLEYGVWPRSSPLQKCTVPAGRSWSANGSGRRR